MRTLNFVALCLCSTVSATVFIGVGPALALEVGASVGGIGAGASVGGTDSGGIGAGAAVGVGSDIGAGAGASIGGAATGAGLGASLGGRDGVDAGAGAGTSAGRTGLGAGLSVGGRSGISAGTAARLGGSGLASGTGVSLGADPGSDGRVVTGVGGTSGLLLGVVPDQASAQPVPDTPAPLADTTGSVRPSGQVTQQAVRGALGRLGPDGATPAQRAAMRRECRGILAGSTQASPALVDLCRVLARL